MSKLWFDQWDDYKGLFNRFLGGVLRKYVVYDQDE